MRSLKVTAPAKINLYLDITGKRPDGYHDIDTVMQTVSLFDTVCIELTDDKTLSLTCSDKTLPTDSKNLAYAAAELMLKSCRIEYGVHIDIEKRIPIAAGLAGGSTDAAAVLCGLNELCNLGLTIEQLCSFGKKLGADVPFCIIKNASRATGIGEILTPCESLPPCIMLISIGKKGIITREAYEKIDILLEQKCAVVKPTVYDYLNAPDLDKKCRCLFNIFEYAGIPDEVNIIKKIMTENGSVGTLMSGSGPSVFGIFYPDDMQKAEAAKEKLESAGFRANIVHSN